jgi:hypothetical protein
MAKQGTLTIDVAMVYHPGDRTTLKATNISFQIPDGLSSVGTVVTLGFIRSDVNDPWTFGILGHGFAGMESWTEFAIPWMSVTADDTQVEMLDYSYKYATSRGSKVSINYP